ncbi:MAG: RdgB/HAM1 family non-canonical purine NTP pyrophosphatase [Gemmatimonadota bacterium]
MTRLVLATANPDKVREIKPLLTQVGVELVAVTDIVSDWAVAETGQTLEENAELKARAAAAALFVAALNGAPGVHSSRFAGETATYRDNLELLLDRLRDVAQGQRQAEFRTAVVVVRPDGIKRVFEGVLRGRIAGSPRGAAGFGYDPVFEVCEVGQTLAELPSSAKNKISHRARAFEALARFLRASPDWLQTTDEPV